MDLYKYANTTVVEFLKLSEGYHIRNSRQLEQTRLICYFIAAANRDPKKHFPSIQKFMPLPTDEENEAKENEEWATRAKEAFERLKKEGRLKPITTNG